MNIPQDFKNNKDVRLKFCETIHTLNEFADLINATKNWYKEYNDIVDRNNWRNMTSEPYGICQNDTGDILHYTKDGQAIIRIGDIDRNIYSLGRQIADLRCKRGLTQKQLSEITGIPQTNISCIEKGRYSMTMKTLSRIVIALQADIVLKEK